MVWWVDKNESNNEIRIYDKYNIKEDRIFQSVNIMFNIAKEINKPYDIYSLLQSGVNIFNIDRTIHDDTSYKLMKKAIYDANQIPEMYPAAYFRPVCLSLTISVAKPVKIDKEINLIILKDVVNKENVVEFKKTSILYPIPVLIWLSNCSNQIECVDIIIASDGIVLDCSTLCKKYYFHIIQLCKTFNKSVFSLRPEVSENIQELEGAKRRLFVTASDVFNDGLDGVVVNGIETAISAQAAIVRNIVEAMKVAEMDHNAEEEFRRRWDQMEPPHLVPKSVTIAASLAALKSEASAIIVLTHSGRTARLLAFSAPPCHVLAITTQEFAAKQMHLYKKVLPVLYQGSRVGNWQEECRKRVLFGTDFAVKAGLLDRGAKLVVLAPSEEGPGYCDGFQIVVVPFKCDE